MVIRLQSTLASSGSLDDHERVEHSDRYRLFVYLCALFPPFIILAALWNTLGDVLPNVPDHIRAISPLLRVEFVHSKSDLDELFGAPGSQIRRATMNRSASGVEDVPALYGFFSVCLAVSMAGIRPKLRKLAIVLIVTSVGFLLVHLYVLNLTADAAKTIVFADEVAQRIYRFALLQWALLFVNILFGSLLFLGSAPEVKSAAYLLILSAILGIVGVAIYNALIPYAALGILFALCGLTLFCAFKPEMV